MKTLKYNKNVKTGCKNQYHPKTPSSHFENKKRNNNFVLNNKFYNILYNNFNNFF